MARFQSTAGDCRFRWSAMSERIDFEIVCPNNHDQTVTFSRDEFEKKLKSDALVFHCNTCDANWSPTTEEITQFRKKFSKQAD